MVGPTSRTWGLEENEMRKQEDPEEVVAIMAKAAAKVARDIMAERPTLTPEEAAADGFERGFTAALRMMNERFPKGL